MTDGARRRDENVQAADAAAWTIPALAWFRGLAGPLSDITAPYAAVDAWVYDRAIAPAVAELLAPMLDQVLSGVRRSAQVLDVGCGGGQALALLSARRPDLRLHGVDLSAQQVGRARARLGARATIVEASAAKLPYSDNRFDVVFSNASIKHWRDPARGVAECVRVLHPGGRLVIAEVDRGCRLDEAAAFVRRWRLPQSLFPVALAVFRTWVAGQAFDQPELAALAAKLPLDLRVSRIDGTPAIALDATKRAPRRALRRTARAPSHRPAGRRAAR